MNAEPRTVTVRTQDHGTITIPEPAWCTGEHPVEGYRSDIVHQGPEVPLRLYSERLQRYVEFLTAYLCQRPFSEFNSPEIVFGGVEHLSFDTAGMRDATDSLIIYALGHLPSLIRQLEHLESGDGQ